MMHHGYVPDLIDHIDGNKTNNNIDNLRPATKSENQYNKKKSTDSISGIKGVTWRSETNKWRVRITVDKKDIDVGYAKTLIEAKKMILEARLKYHKEFSNEG